MAPKTISETPLIDRAQNRLPIPNPTSSVTARRSNNQKDDSPHNVLCGGHFAKPTKQWFREIIEVERLVRDGTADPKGEGRE